MDYKRIKAVIFDLDGTMLDTLVDITTCIHTALSHYGIPHEMPGFESPIYAGGLRSIMEGTLTEETPSEEMDKAEAFYLNLYREKCVEHTKCYPHVREALSALHEMGLELGVITNKTETIAQKIIGHFYPEIPFKMVWGNNFVRPLKPAADVGVQACQLLGLQNTEVAFVGDSVSDMRFAKNAGFYALGAGWGYMGKEALLGAGADEIMPDPLDIPELFK